MTTEEKARAYDEALERLKGLIEGTREDKCAIVEEDIIDIFPELKESEDEKIRKEIISALKNANYKGVYDKHLAWLEKQKPIEHFELKAGHWYICHRPFCCRADHLTVKEGEKFMCEKDGVAKGFIIKDPEKYFRETVPPAPYEDEQGEQKSADNVEPKFKVGDWCIDNEDGTIFQIVKVLDNTYIYKTTEGSEYSCTHYSLENDAKLWTIQDAKDGDVLVASDDSIFIFKGTIDCACKHYVALTTDNVVELNEGLEHYWETSGAAHPATKEQRDLLFSKMKEAGYEWDVKKKELKRIEQVDGFDAEPKESKDEMIRKGITKSILNLNSDWLELCGVTKEDALVWLEKQGEQKAILDELEMTLSVSEDRYLRSNIEGLIKELKKEEQQ